MAALAAVLGAGPGWAGVAQADTLWGSRSTGTLTVPSADTGPAGELTIGAGVAAGEGLRGFVRYQLTDELEVGLALPAGASPDGSSPGVLVRYRILSEQGPAPALAVGVDGRRGYVVASHRLPGPLLRLHAGVRAEKRGMAAFAGLSAVLNPVTVRRPGALPVPVVSVGVEYDGTALGAGATFQWGPGLAVAVGVRDRGALQLVGGVAIRSIP